ncbi:TPA: hypothetical protein DD690_03155 [Candidatus Daviesbacteria bacterium]|nr:MAG: hypothetical protein A3E67_02825 [Candidatus Daviesbacteria bacterium RIFCSPHIGHO2_12_FULL_38_25]OGE68597.1 MAG: hypothetical protein A3H81_03140 [Candidatus Daviesbacteria bacterium RIFCSPLOWO2_02_FULL_38_18]OGE72911.1 MAG: hypothetical protein A3H18_01855 [Candidatus Daviesbacteria bacterium RIFCSPLOWO2_12_FULL_38_10]HBQ50954.1 hypothetical protein [Candidatus Daviesbacteria bacterium]HCB22542.1 hypothetical protein [Candidatus Daviesbacteria bacterium]
MLAITLLVYSISNRGEGAQWNHFVYLADAFLRGHLYIPNILTELASWNGHYFVVYPPMPAILLMPFVAIFGTSFYQPVLSIVLGAVNVLLAYTVLLKLFKSSTISLWISLLYAFGTIQWYHAEVGSSWYVAHIVALFFLWLALLEIVTKQRLFLIGLFIGAAYLARLPTILSVVFVFIYLRQTLNIKNIFLFLLGLSPGILFNGFYNYLRFGTIFDVGYSLLPIFNEPWYKYGLFSIRYLPLHLKEVFTSLPAFSKNPPFIIPSIYIMAIWFTTPAFLLIIKAKFKTKLALASLIAVIIIALPGLLHGNNGSTQFGYRFALDFMPFLLLLMASGIINRFNWQVKLLIILSVLVNLWGVIMISFLNKWVI